MRFRVPFYALMLLIFTVTAAAQGGACPDLVKTALAAADQLCAPASRNQACYGNVDLSVTAQPTVADFNFDTVGDIEDVLDIQSLRLAGMNESANTWGVVVMRLQANIPNTLPGQNVTFLLFGDVEVVNMAEGSATPMQAFMLRTGFQDSLCEAAPASGLLVQTPAGVGQVTFTVNGVDVSMGSTVHFQAQRGGTMKVRTVQGVATITAEGRPIPVIAGTESDIPMTEDLLPAGEPSLPEPYDLDEVSNLPIEALDYDIEIADPLDEAYLDELYAWAEGGDAICDVDPFPDCDDLPVEVGGSACIMVADEAGMTDGSLSYCDEDDWAAFEAEAAELEELMADEQDVIEDEALSEPEFEEPVEETESEESFSEEPAPEESVSEDEPPAEEPADEGGDDVGGEE
ncbi:MAG: hypothetical protein K8I30_09900 [Anaerolineae bacterium]|nr:hypothetical protein [Anaerolineae bacterium]